MATKTEIVLFLVLWLAIVSTMFSLLGTLLNQDLGVSEKNEGSKFFNFDLNIITGINIMPVWFNSIVFGSLGVLITWLIVSSAPTINGGG